MSLEAQIERAKHRLSQLWPEDPEYERVHEEVHRLVAMAHELKSGPIRLT